VIKQGQQIKTLIHLVSSSFIKYKKKLNAINRCIYVLNLEWDSLFQEPVVVNYIVTAI